MKSFAGVLCLLLILADGLQAEESPGAREYLDKYLKGELPLVFELLGDGKYLIYGQTGHFTFYNTSENFCLDISRQVIPQEDVDSPIWFIMVVNSKYCANVNPGNADIHMDKVDKIENTEYYALTYHIHDSEQKHVLLGTKIGWPCAKEPKDFPF